MSFKFNVINPTLENQAPGAYLSEQHQKAIGQSIANNMNALNYGINREFARPTAQQALKEALLKNAHQSLINKYYGPNIESEIGLRGAQAGHFGMLNKEIGFNLANPLLKSTATAPIGALLADPRFAGYVKQALGGAIPGQEEGNMAQEQVAPRQMQGPVSQGNMSMIPRQNGQIVMPQDQQQIAQSLAQTGIGKELQNTQKRPTNGAQELVNSILQGSLSGAQNKVTPYERMSAQDRRAMLAQARTWNYDDVTANDLLRKGYSLSDLAEMQGISRDPSTWEPPDYRDTGTTQTKKQTIMMANAANKVMDPIVTKGLKNYTGQLTAKGIPVGFIHDALTGKNKDKQADFISATILAQDQALSRAKTIGASLGITILNHMLTTTLADVKADFRLQDPEVLQKVSDRLTDTFNKMADAQLNAGTKRESSGQRTNKKVTLQDLDKMSDEEFEAYSRSQR